MEKTDILVLGNGFDIAHGLPTTYLEFLEFINSYLGEDENCTDQLKEFIERFKSSKSTSQQEVQKYLFDEWNGLLKYFLNLLGENTFGEKNGWIDFEKEISQTIQMVDGVISEESNNRRALFLSGPRRNLATILFNNEAEQRIFLNNTLSDESINSITNNLLHYLNTLTRLLEIYIVEYVEKIYIARRIPEIEALKNIKHILNFNYTDTYRCVYENSDADCCFIHGRATNDSSLDTCSLVLGIDEYLNDDRRDNDNKFIWFKKFYQRIYKETSSDYIDWLEEHDKWNYDHKNSPPQILNIFFYGHSLDITDKDVLYRLIMHNNSKIHIFYHNKNAMAKQISNLVKIISEDNLIAMTRGKNRVIEFIPVKSEKP